MINYDNRQVAHHEIDHIFQDLFPGHGMTARPSQIELSHKMLDAMKAFDEIINQMPESEKAFDLAKDALITRLRTERITKSDVLWAYMYAQDLGLSVDTRKALFEQVQQMSLADVKAFQEKWVKDRKYVYVVLGDEKDLNMKGLSEYGPIEKLTQEALFGY